MKKAIVFQVMIFVLAWVLLTPDVLEDNTHLFGLFGSYDLVRGNAHWVMLGAAILSALNIWLWWPKSPTRQSVEVVAETKSAEVKTEEVKTEVAEDPAVPKMD